MAEEGIELPVRDGGGDRIRWQRAEYEALRRVLKNPVYAGAYVYGRRQVETYLDTDQQPLKRLREQPDSNWHVLIKDHHEGYISWETFERNQRRIAANRRGQPTGGAPREGTSSLHGLGVRCSIVAYPSAWEAEAESLPLADPIARPEPDFQFDQTLSW